MSTGITKIAGQFAFKLNFSSNFLLAVMEDLIARFVHFVRSNTGLLKIGRASNLVRLSSLRTANPDLVVEAWIETDQKASPFSTHFSLQADGAANSSLLILKWPSTKQMLFLKH